jgi:hypothetical protein
MTQISAQSPVLTPAKQSKKRVPDKVLLGPKQATDSQNAGGNFIEKVFEFFKKLQATVEALLEKLGKYLEDLGEKLTSPKTERRDESSSPPLNRSGSAERSSDGVSGASHDKDTV